MANKKGRPTRHTQAIAEIICERLALGESLRSICNDESMPVESTVRAWALDDREGFYAQYVRARNIALDIMADEIIEIADGQEDAQTKRIRFDARRWYLSKLAPKRYGERQQIDHTTTDRAVSRDDIDSLSDEELMEIATTGNLSTKGN